MMTEATEVKACRCQQAGMPATAQQQLQVGFPAKCTSSLSKGKQFDLGMGTVLRNLSICSANRQVNLILLL